MKTPKDYQNNLKNKIITKEMLLDCLYSSNKRAKNYRDKVRELRNYFRYNKYAYDKYGNIEKALEKKEEYYAQKEEMLSILEPVCIHKEFIHFERQRIYDYEKDYIKYQKKGNFVWENCYFDEDLMREVWFGNIETENKIFHYYLFYDLGGNHTFHSPIKESDVIKFKQQGLIIEEIDTLETQGHDITDLISNQFVKKVITLIKSKDFELRLED